MQGERNRAILNLSKAIAKQAKGEIVAEKDDNTDLKRALFTVSDAVLGAAVLLALGVYGGAWLDKQFNCAPFLSVGLALLGGGIGLARMVMKAQALDKNSKIDKSKLKTLSGDDWDKDSWSDVKIRSTENSLEEAKSEGKVDSPEKSSAENSSEKKPYEGRESPRFRLPHEGFSDE